MAKSTTKPCNRCGSAKPFSDFNKRTVSPDGLQPICRDCEKSTKAVRYLRNREAVRAKQREYYLMNSRVITERAAKWQNDNPDRVKSSRLSRYARNPDGQRNRQLKCDFNITLADYNEMLADQGGVCAICEKCCASGMRLAVDHDHGCCPGKKSCGRCVRGLLCRDCNVSMGKFGDDSRLLRRAADYLEEHRGL